MDNALKISKIVVHMLIINAQNAQMEMFYVIFINNIKL